MTLSKFLRTRLLGLLLPAAAAGCGGADETGAGRSPADGNSKFEVAISIDETGGVDVVHSIRVRTIADGETGLFERLVWLIRESSRDDFVAFSVKGEAIHRYPVPRLLEDRGYGEWFARVGQLVSHIERDSEVRRALLAADGDRAAVRDNFVREFGEEGFAGLTEIAGGERNFHDLAERLAASFQHPSKDAGGHS